MSDINTVRHVRYSDFGHDVDNRPLSVLYDDILALSNFNVVDPVALRIQVITHEMPPPSRSQVTASAHGYPLGGRFGTPRGQLNDNAIPSYDGRKLQCTDAQLKATHFTDLICEASPCISYTRTNCKKLPTKPPS